jgi:hypothetical protein
MTERPERRPLVAQMRSQNAIIAAAADHISVRRRCGCARNGTRALTLLSGTGPAGLEPGAGPANQPVGVMNNKLLSIAAAAGLLIATTAIADAQSRGGNMGGSPGGGASSVSPGHEMKSPNGSGERSEGGPGASGFSPGHEMQEGEGRGGPGASRLAPGHNKGTTGSGDRDDVTPRRSR